MPRQTEHMVKSVAIAVGAIAVFWLFLGLMIWASSNR